MMPGKERFTRAEWRIVERHGTPHRAQQWLYSLRYNTEERGETLRSFRGVVRHGESQCLESALAAAVVLERRGYPPLLLDLESQDDLDHVLFLYRVDGCWGTVAKSRDPGLHGRRPVFRRLDELVRSYVAPFVDYTGRITAYGVADLRDLGRYDWRLSTNNLWKVRQHLIDLPHTPLRTSDREYRRWHDRYCAYKRRYPHLKPLYYPGKHTWIRGYPKGGR
ncbi:MAG: hypothetical protein JRI23_17880 [Deltaproteobacteria bacterium]|jgi:hypothetical protein|nr:hypothetical protein [Deltaproteobacteria bacterium]MBW2533708.1 hypothetical protein [Deltaproteobacteria bacterium]